MLNQHTHQRQQFGKSRTEYLDIIRPKSYKEMTRQDYSFLLLLSDLSPDPSRYRSVVDGNHVGSDMVSASQIAQSDTSTHTDFVIAKG
jgi:hypothetical protein